MGNPRQPASFVLLAAVALTAAACAGAGDGTTTTATTVGTETTTTGLLSTTTEPPAGFEQAPWPTEGWPVSSPEEQGMDSARLADMVEQLPESGIDSVTIIRNGYLVLDAVVYPFPNDTMHIVHSCTKSVVGSLIGMAIEEGLIAGVDVPVVEILTDAAPTNPSSEKAAMTIESLLTMSTGLQCRDSYLYAWQGLAEMIASDDWTAHVLALPMAAPPGERFEYCNGSSFLLSAILSATTGMAASDYAADKLFEPLGITEYDWPADPDGVTIGWGELALHPVDMAKFGYLYLRDGKWEGRQLIPASWVEESTQAHARAGTLSDAYGYQWWISNAGYSMALGFGGQYIIVDPNRDLVIAFTSGLGPERFGLPEQLATVYVIPAVDGDSPLPPNPAAQERLAAAIAAAHDGPEPTAQTLPDIAAEVDGVRYQFRENSEGNEWFELRFEEGSATFQSKGVDGIPLLSVGLDGRYVIDSTLPVAMRGSWLLDNRFRIEYQVLGLEQRGTIELTFEGDTATVRSYDAVTDTTTTVVADRVEVAP